MGKKQQEKEVRVRSAKKKQNTKIMITAVIVVCVLAGAVYLGYANSQKNKPNGIDAAVNETGDLVIAKEQLKNGLNIVEFDGQEELLVYSDGSGSYMTAFDTCEECFGNGYVNYTLKNKLLHCSSCGSTVPLDVLGSESWGGCQPVSVPESYRSDTDDTLVVPQAVLSYANDVFAQWEGGNHEATLADYPS